jgi:3-methyl-2-oxobutanoate hydroxymethyltransferase
MMSEADSSGGSVLGRMTVPRFVSSKSEGRRLVMLTAYDAMWASLFDESGVDALLVGDTLGMVVQGHDTTLPVTLDEMIYHARMVVRGSSRAMVVVDMPFMTYQLGPEQAMSNAGRILKETGASAVKLEGGESQAETIRALSRADIPVMAHVGMKPQSVHMLGGMSRIQRDAERLRNDARAAAEAGAFAVVLELIPRGIAEEISGELSIPTIGIGAGPGCDGQVLVNQDMLGLSNGFNPKFLKRYADLRSSVLEAVSQYAEDVRAGTFPDDAHSHE